MDDNSNKLAGDKPPFLGSWNKIYWIVFGALIILITLFYLFTKAFS